MKKVFTFLVALVIGALGFAANAVNVTFNINKAGAAYISYYDYEKGQNFQYTLSEETNTYEIGANSYVYIYSQNSYLLTSVTAENAYPYGSTSYWYFSVYDGDDVTVNITALTPEEAYTDTCYITVDDSTAVQAQFSSSSRRLTLTEADTETAVKFMASSENTLQLSHATYGKTLYEVTKNGEPVTVSSYIYLTVADGDHISIKANYPDEKALVTFNYGEGAEGFITSVMVDGVAVEDFSKGFEAQLGSVITLYGDTQNYSYDSILINGEKISYFYSSTQFTLTKATEIEVNAHKYSTLNVVLDIDNPDNVSVYRGYTYNNDLLTLTSGKNEIEVTEQTNFITVKPASGCYITSISDGETEYYTSGSSETRIYVTDGMELTFITGAIERDKQLVVYIDDKSAAVYSFYMQRSDRSEVSLSSGYNTVDFYDGDNNFYAAWYGASYNNFYINDELVSPVYAGGTSYQATFNDGDVAKIFIASDPEKYNVTFDVDDELASSVTVVKDLITTVTDYSEGFETLQGTQVELSVATTADIDVKVNNVAVDASEGVYTFVVDSNSAVSIKMPQITGIEQVVSTENENATVYNLQGIVIKKSASGSEVKALPAGVYVINGKKVVVK